MIMIEQSLLSKYVHITLAVSAYWVVSIITVFVNKILLSSQAINLDAPLFITWFQCVVSALICIVMCFLSNQFPHLIRFPNGNPLRKDVIINVIPLSILFTAMIATNNLCLKFVAVAFYYIGRSLTTIFNVMLSYLILKEKTSLSCICFCLMIIGGFLLGVDQENLSGSLSIMGTFFGILGSFFLSLYSIYTKRVLPKVNEEVWLLSYYNNVYSSILFLPLIVINGEIQVILNYTRIFDISFWLILTASGICGFAIGFFTALQIKVTSPLTHNISGTAKACAQTVLATYIYSEYKGFLWWLSNIIVLVGSAGYARIRQLEMEIRYKLTQKV